MLGRPLRESVAMRATMDRRRTSPSVGSSAFIAHLVEHSVIPGDHLERNHLEPGVAGGRIPRSFGALHPTTDVDGTQIEEIHALVDEEHDLSVFAWSLLGMLRDTNEVATVMPHQHNRLRLRPLVRGKGDACTRNPLEEIACAIGIDVPGNVLHEHFPWSNRVKAILLDKPARLSSF